MMKTVGHFAILLLCLLGLGGCFGPTNPSVLTASQSKNDIESKSYHISFTQTGNDTEMRAHDGLSLPDFLRDLALDPPGYVSFRPSGDSFDEPRLLDMLQQSGLARSSDIELRPTTANPKGPALTVEVTYYYYRLANCGTDLEFRKLDHIALTSPGFGCAVERNRMLSLARPADWHYGRPLAAPLAGPDVKAVTIWQNADPTPFPQQNN
ncbi:MAG: hypothetical protein WDZ54_06855 [Sneathiella sp.]